LSGGSGMSDITLDTRVAARADAPSLPAPGYWKSVGQRILRDKVTMVVSLLLLGILFITLGAPLVTHYDPYVGSVLTRLKPIGTPGHWLGTDETGRDLWTRLCYGGRLSLLAAILPVTISLIVGGFLGILAGYAGGIAGTLIMRTMDVFYAFPSVLLAVAISGAMGGGMANGMAALALVFIPAMCRVAETATAQVRSLDFIEAARATGAGTFTIVRYHVLGNVLGPVFIYASSLVSVSILLASGLSFLGLGVKPPTPDWGLMLSTLRQSIYVAPLLCALPGAAIFVTSICFNLVSDGIRSAMDVRL
jgi:peptide/nickel transport system permease protein